MNNQATYFALATAAFISISGAALALLNVFDWSLFVVGCAIAGITVCDVMLRANARGNNSVNTLSPVRIARSSGSRTQATGY